VDLAHRPLTDPLEDLELADLLKGHRCDPGASARRGGTSAIITPGGGDVRSATRSSRRPRAPVPDHDRIKRRGPLARRYEIRAHIWPLTLRFIFA
jgi:hypothetical protein